METFSEDTQYILQQAGLEDKLSVEWKHRTGRYLNKVGGRKKDSFHSTNYFYNLVIQELVGVRTQLLTISASSQSQR